MPMEATPFEQVLAVAEATKCTGPCTVTPLAGAVTFTPAKTAGAPIANRHAIPSTYFCMRILLQSDYLLPTCRTAGETALARERARGGFKRSGVTAFATRAINPKTREPKLEPSRWPTRALSIGVNQ